MSRPAHARIDLNALARNYIKARRLHGGRTLAVLKADAYGHGAVHCARRLDGIADGLAVAFTDEAAPLRSVGVRSPILVLEGAFSESELRNQHLQDLWTVVHHEEQLRMLECAKHPARSMCIWLKVDSGMRRAGFAPSEVRAVHERLLACASVDQVVLMTHFARADQDSQEDREATQRQIEAFDSATQGIAGLRSLCNSAGILSWPDARRDWGRCGIALYGVSPARQCSVTFEPVMQLASEIFAVRDINPGDTVGYGGSFVAQRPMRIGLVAMGYADGYPRAAGTGTPVLVDGVRSSIVGRVSMDMITVDITEATSCGPGSTVEFWGAGIDVDQVAAQANTIPYELLCNVKRVHKTYVAVDP